MVVMNQAERRPVPCLVERRPRNLEGIKRIRRQQLYYWLVIGYPLRFRE
jgi:hypothetical protein